jgi:hypothetical protein
MKVLDFLLEVFTAKQFACSIHSWAAQGIGGIRTIYDKLKMNTHRKLTILLEAN